MPDGGLQLGRKVVSFNGQQGTPGICLGERPRRFVKLPRQRTDTLLGDAVMFGDRAQCFGQGVTFAHARSPFAGRGRFRRLECVVCPRSNGFHFRGELCSQALLQIDHLGVCGGGQTFFELHGADFCRV